MEQEVTDYIVQAQRHGLSDFEIKQNLLNAGWDAGAVEESFVFAKAAENHFLTPKGKVTSAGETFSVSAAKTGGLTALENQSTQTVSYEPSTLGVKDSAPFYKRWLFWTVLILLLALAGGAYGYYNYIYTTPARVWSGMAAAAQSSSEQVDYTISYNDPTATTTESFSISGSNQNDSSDIANIKSAGTSTIAIKNGSISYSVQLNYSVFGQVLYLDLGDITQLQQLLGQNLGWVKIDFVELQNYLKTKLPGSSVQDQQLNNPALQAQLKQIWSTANIVTPTNYLNREKLNGVNVYHLKAQVNSSALNSAFTASLAAIQAQEPSSTPIDATNQAEISALLNKFQVRQLDFWVGQSDHKTYKTTMQISAPSVNDMTAGHFAGSILPAGPERDARRIADVMQIQTGLQLYHNDFGGYPASQNGLPQNFDPTYLGVYPTAPTPADGNCTNYYNGYWYKTTGSPRTVNGQKVYPSYTFTFCLGQATGGYQAGIGMLTPSGIQSNIACPTTSDLCVATSQQTAQDFSTQINQMTFGGIVSIELDFSKFGQNFNLQPPPNPTDLLQLLQGQDQTASSSAVNGY